MRWQLSRVFIGIAAAIAAAIAAVSGLGAESPLPGTVVSLEGSDWKVAADPNNTGRDQAWWREPGTDARPTRVPGIMQEALPGYHGVAWFWEEFTAPQKSSEAGRCLLRFHAVHYRAQVWVNDIPVGEHEGGETPFNLDITEAVKPGETNQVAVRVLNPKEEPIDGVRLSETPHRNKIAAGIGVGGSYNSGGITEPAEVFWTPAVRMNDVYARPDATSGKVGVQVNLFNAGATTVPCQFQLAIASASANEPMALLNLDREVPPGRSQVECSLMVRQPRLWGLEEPFLYRLTTRVTSGNSRDTHKM